MRQYSLLCKISLYCLLLLLIYPTSPAIFKRLISLKESAFICPVSTEGSVVPVRADTMGDGHFGARRSGGRRRHKGLDIAGRVGQSVFAAKSGIAATGEVPRGMGRYVKVSHFDGYVTIYGHLDSITVADKSWIWQGQEIGKIGKTGNAAYPRIESHLHFEIMINGGSQDPLRYITLDKRRK